MISSIAWEALGEYKVLCGHRIFCIDNNKDAEETVLLLHGFPTSSWDWEKIWYPLSAKYRLVALDMLGFGYSDKPEAHTYSIHEQADIVEALVENAGLNRLHVLAHDYGDTVAQELLARQNEGAGVGTWQSICFLNGGLFPETHKALLIQKLLVSPLGPLINKLTTRRRFDASMRQCFGPETPPDITELDGFWALINHKNGRHIFHNLITYMNDRKTHRARWVMALEKAKMPLGLINGSVDPVSGAHMIARFKEVVGTPGFLIELPAIGHYPHIEAPDEVGRGYLGFIGSSAI